MSASAPPRLRKPNLRAAFRACIGLRVEAAVGGIAVFREAGRAHRELRHARGGAVVGDCADNRKPRPAMRAIGEGIAVAAVGGSRISARQAGQVAASAAMPVLTAPRWLSTIRKPAPSNAAASGVHSMASMRAKGGASADSAISNSASAAAGPQARISTPSPSFSTSPDRPKRCASRQTVGRKPTPCTSPRTRMETPGLPRCPRSSIAHRLRR